MNQTPTPEAAPLSDVELNAVRTAMAIETHEVEDPWVHPRNIYATADRLLATIDALRSPATPDTPTWSKITPPKGYQGWTCGRCGGPVAGGYSKCENCGFDPRAKDMADTPTDRGDFGFELWCQYHSEVPTGDLKLAWLADVKSSERWLAIEDRVYALGYRKSPSTAAETLELRAALRNMADAYVRKVKTGLSADDIAKEPWRCMEYIEAERLCKTPFKLHFTKEWLMEKIKNDPDLPCEVGLATTAGSKTTAERALLQVLYEAEMLIDGSVVGRGELEQAIYEYHAAIRAEGEK